MLWGTCDGGHGAHHKASRPGRQVSRDTSVAASDPDLAYRPAPTRLQRSVRVLGY